jgi:hypothetical protein
MDFPTALAIEAWTLWSIGMILVAARMYGILNALISIDNLLTNSRTSRLMALGSIKKLQADDWIMLFTVVCPSEHYQLYVLGLTSASSHSREP